MFKFLFSEPCVAFLKRLAAEMGLPAYVYYPVNSKNPVVVITWVGTQPSLPSIMLNTHTDVVPVYEQYWSRPPFAADIDEYGRIIARGTQDTKAMGMIHLAAVRALKRSGVQLKRTIHVTFTPDEELGGFNGMAGFVTSAAFKAMNVGYALDEGGVSESNNIGVFYDERCPYQIELAFNGPTGHASLLFPNTAGEKLVYVTDKFMKWRADEMKKLASGYPYGRVTSINLTILKGGVQANVVPTDFTATFDIRLSVDVDHAAFERQVSYAMTPQKLKRHCIVLRFQRSQISKRRVISFQFFRFSNGVMKPVEILASTIYLKRQRLPPPVPIPVIQCGLPLKIQQKNCKLSMKIPNFVIRLLLSFVSSSFFSNITVTPTILVGATDVRFLRRVSLNEISISVRRALTRLTFERKRMTKKISCAWA